VASIYLLIFAPLVGFLINGMFGKQLPEKVSGAIGSLAILISFVVACTFFIHFYNGATEPIEVVLLPWISFAGLTINFGFLVDQLSSLWLMIITGIGFLIHVYSVGYMHGDEAFGRFFAYLNLFVFFMLTLVLGNNLLITFIGWEGVGLCSYLLIGFWFKNQDYNNAAKKAFIMNRIGDLGFLIGIFLLLFYFKTLDYTLLKTALAGGGVSVPLITAITLCLFIGAMGKSAQLPLYTWLPDAMAGPTPVSALIHAATMVTAGIYLIARTDFMFLQAPATMQFVAIVGALTALFAATIGLLQNDIKKVLAYSTVSQLGLMFVAMGVGAFSTGVFHVITHAFFKACLFLGAGSVIHAMGGEQDIRKMGGLKKYMPITYITFILSSLAISGVPVFSGFFSKDEILAAAFEHNKVLWVIASLASLMTAFYMFRLVFLTFFNDFRGTEDQKNHLHESPLTITFPLMVLAFFAVVGGLMGLPAVISHSHWLKGFLSPVLTAQHAHEISHATEWILMGLATTLALGAIGFAYIKYIGKNELPAEEGTLSGFSSIVYQKYKVDEIYHAVFVRPLLALSSFAYSVVDTILIDNIPEGVASLTGKIGKRMRLIQTGNIGFYLLAMVVGVFVILGYVFLK
jgi:NADH-quinone oxidoreductase subunit L